MASASSEPVGPATPKATGTLARSFIKAAEKGWKAIEQKAKFDLEMQAIVMNAITEFEEAKKEASKSMVQVVDMVQASRDARKRKREDYEALSDPEEISRRKVSQERDKFCKLDDVPLRRGQMTFGCWSLKLCRQLLLYCDDGLNLSLVSCLTQRSLYECLEHGFELKCFGDNLDRCGTSSKRLLFSSLKNLYKCNGSKLSNIEVDTDTGTVNWDSCAELSKGDMKDEGLEVVYQPSSAKASPITKILDKDVWGDDPGPFTLVRTYSVAAAAVKGFLGEYPVVHLFPMSKRKLGRRLSETLGVCVKVSGHEAKQAAEAKQKAMRAKPKLTGIHRLKTKIPLAHMGGEHVGQLAVGSGQPMQGEKTSDTTTKPCPEPEAKATDEVASVPLEPGTAAEPQASEEEDPPSPPEEPKAV